MHDLRLVREQLDVLRDGMRRRGEARRARAAARPRRGARPRAPRAIQAVEERKAARNADSAGSRAPQEGGRGRRRPDRAGPRARRGDRAPRARARRRRSASCERILLELPNITLAGRARRAARRATSSCAAGATPRAGDGVRPHWEIGESSACSTSSAARRSAARASSCSAARGARLVRALMNFFLDVHTREHGYEEVWVPVRRESRVDDRHGAAPEVRGRHVRARGTRTCSSFRRPRCRSRTSIATRSSTAPQLPRVRAPTRRASAARRSGGQGHARPAARAPVRQGRARALLHAGDSRASEHELLTRHAETLLSGSGFRTASCCSRRATPASRARKTYDLEVWAPGVGDVARGLVVQHVHRLPGAPREHPLSAGAGREAALRAHAQRVGARVPAHHRRDPRALPAGRRHGRRFPRCCGRISGTDAHRAEPMRRGASRLHRRRRRASSLLLGSYVVYTQRVVARAAARGARDRARCTRASTRR